MAESVQTQTRMCAKHRWWIVVGVAVVQALKWGLAQGQPAKDACGSVQALSRQSTGIQEPPRQSIQVLSGQIE